jgi:hypothetical protein
MAVKTNNAAKVVAWLAMTMLAGSAWAGSVAIISPDKAQTAADCRVKAANLTWSETDHALYADITFSNDIYVGGAVPLVEDYFLFAFPGVSADPATKTFYAPDSNGHRVPVATWEDGAFGRHIKLLPGAFVHIQKKHGNVRVVLTATTTPTMAARRNHWVEDNTSFMTEHLAGR